MSESGAAGKRLAPSESHYFFRRRQGAPFPDRSMIMLSKRFRTTAVTLLILVGLCVTAAEAMTEPVMSALLGLRGADTQKKQAAYELFRKEGDASLVPILEAYKKGMLENRDGRLIIYGPRVQGPDGRKLYPLLDALSGKPLVDSDGKEQFAETLGTVMMRANRRDRKTISALVKILSLQHSDPYRRIAAIVSAGKRADAGLLPALKEQLQAGPAPNIGKALKESIAHIQLAHGNKEEKIEAAELLGGTGASRCVHSLHKAMADEGNPPEVKTAVSKALQKIERHQRIAGFIQNLFSGLSLGSILILMALGLAVIFGLMGVINMAQGEFMMLGAFTTYVVCEFFKHHVPAAGFNYYFVCAVPAAFAVTALTGMVCEWAFIRHLYGRPLETLLATWGLSLVLIQAIRVLFGDTLSLTPPDQLTGSWQVAEDIVFPLNRLFIIAFCGMCTLLFYLIERKTKLGLLLRATVQDRDTAGSLGVATRRVDSLTFGLGTGLAGLAGCVIPLYDKINPGMGQGYVVDSFMVVVLGGLGKLAGVIVGGLGLGFLTKFVEPYLQAVYGKTLVLAMIVVFLQWRPAGLFPSGGRLADE